MYEKAMHTLNNVYKSCFGQKKDLNFQEEQELCLFSIKISPKRIDEIAQKLKIMVNLTVINSDL